jgi:uncharacterized protein with PQ loop repeat
MIEKIGLVSSIVMPLFNIPLIVKVIRRKSSEDISKSWLFGVWGCAILMAPAGFTSTDIVWRCFNVVNLVLFTGVVITVLKYRKK